MEYRVIVEFSTQRDYFRKSVRVNARDEDEAQALACGIVWINEHIGKDRYIKIHKIVVVEE